MNAKATHPALLRTTDAIAEIGARQGARSLPVMALVTVLLIMQVGAVAAIMFG